MTSNSNGGSGRDHWRSGVGLALAATGSAIGLANLWKFPQMVWIYGGGPFVWVYLVAIAVIGLPLMIAALLLGRSSACSMAGAMRQIGGRAWGAFGRLGVLCGCVLLGFYCVIGGWSLYFAWKAIVWSIGGLPSTVDLGAAFGAQIQIPGLQVGLSLLFSIATAGVVYAGVQKGIESLSRMFLPVLFGILLLLLVVAFGMSGFSEALAFLLTREETSTNIDFWPSGVLAAMGHALFTLSLGMGTMVAYGSYMSRSQSIVRVSGAIVVLDTLVALVATVVMLSVIFSFGMSDQIAQGETAGMLFSTMLTLFYDGISYGHFLAPLFYVLVALAAITSSISMLEVVVSYLVDERGLDRKRATVVSSSAIFTFTALCALSNTSVLPLSITQEDGLMDFADLLVTNWMLPIGGLAIALTVGWLVPSSTTRTELLDGKAPVWFSHRIWLWSVKIVAPVALAIVILAVLFGRADFRGAALEPGPSSSSASSPSSTAPGEGEGTSAEGR